MRKNIPVIVSMSCLAPLLAIFIAGCAPTPTNAVVKPIAVSDYDPADKYDSDDNTMSGLTTWVKVSGVGLKQIVTKSKKPAQALVFDWKNIGNKPIRILKADVTFFGADGQPTEASETNEFVFVGKKGHPVNPGQTAHVTANDDIINIVTAGLIPKATRVSVKVTDARW